MKSELRTISVCATVVLMVLLTADPTEGMSYSHWRASGSLRPGYRSNVFKAPPSYPLNGDQIWDLGAGLYYWHHFDSRFTLRLRPEVATELYSRHNQRNQVKVAGEARLEFALSDVWKFRLNIGTDRSNRDLVDDAGEFSGRTLSKWTHEMSPEVRFTFDKFRSSIQYRRQLVDYDEETDDAGEPLKSYDYDRDLLELNVNYRFVDWLDLGLRHEREWRDYTERITLSIDKRNSEIRSFHEHTTDLDAELKFGRIQPSIGYRFTKRTDTFENFYGYEYSRFETAVKVFRMWQSEFEVSFSYAEKDYPNYWTSRIGYAHRVAIEYRDWRFDWEYPLTNMVDIGVGLRWYIKTSNDRNFRYRQLTTLIGASISFGN